MKSKNLLLVLLLCLLSWSGYSATYYSRTGTSLDLSNLANWTTSNTGSGGSSPANFSTGGDIWNVNFGTTPVVSSTLNIAGTVSVATGITLTLNAATTCSGITLNGTSVLTCNAALTGAVTMVSTSTLNYNVNASYPTFSSLASTCTVNFGGTGVAHTIPAATYGNLTVSSTGTSNFMTTAATTVYTVAGNFLLNSSGTVNLCNVSTGTANATLNVSGTFINSGTGTFSANASSGGVSNAVVAVTGAMSITSTGTLNANNASGGTSYARIQTSSTFSMATAGFVNVNKASGGTPTAKLQIGSTYTQSNGTVVIGSSTATDAVDTLLVTGTTAISASAVFTVGAGTASNAINRYIGTGAVTLSGGTVNVSTHTGGTATNTFNANAAGTSITFSGTAFNGAFASGAGTYNNSIVVATNVSHTTSVINLNRSSLGTSTMVMSVGGTYAMTSSGTLNINSSTGGTSNYSRLEVTGAFSTTTTAGTININSASGGTNPVGRLRCLSSYSQAVGVMNIGASSVANAADTLDVATTASISTASANGFNMCTGTGATTNNNFIIGTSLTFSTTTFNMCTSTSGSSNNTLTINGSGGTVLTLTSGTFNGAFSTASSGAFTNTINIPSSTGNVSIVSCIVNLNRITTGGTSDVYVNIGGSITMTTGQINLNTATAGTTRTFFTLGTNFALTSSGQLNINSATGGTPTARMNIGGTLGLTTGTIRIGNSTVSGATDTLAVTGNTTITSGTFIVGTNNGTSTNNVFLETGTYTQNAGTVSLSTNTGGSGTNLFQIASTSAPAFSIAGGTFNLCASTTATSTLTNTLTCAGGFALSAGTFRMSAATITGTYNNTASFAGVSTQSGGSILGNAGFGTSTLNFTSTSPSCFTMSGAAAMTLISSANAGNMNLNISGGFTDNSTGLINLESVSATSGVSTIQVDSNATFNSASGTWLSWGSGIVANNAFNVRKNLSFAGAGTLTAGSPSGTQATGFVFNGAGTSASPQTFSWTSSGVPSWGPIYVVNSGTYVKLLTNMVLPVNTAPTSWMQVNSGGILDCSTFVLSGGAASGSTGLTLNGTLVTANTGGVGSSITTTVKTFASNANFIFNGTSAQVGSSTLPASFGSLTIDNTAGVSLSQSATLLGNLTLTNGKLRTGAFTLSMGGGASVTGASATNYVLGTLSKTITGLSSVSYEVGDTTYAPVLLTLTGASAGSISAKSTYGGHPQMATSGITTSGYATHYWTLANIGATLTTIVPKFTYNLADIVSGSNSGFATQRYASSVWLDTASSSTNTTTPYSTMPSSISASDFAGDYIVGLKAGPVLTAASGATVDNPFIITYSENAAWRTTIIQVKVNSNVLPGAAYSISTAGQLTLTPSASTYLQTSGSFYIIVSAPGYADDSVLQVIGSGAAHHLSMSVNPGDATYNGGPLSPQPVVAIRDQYSNLTSSASTVTAGVGSGSWSIGGTTSVAAVAGLATFASISGTAGSSVSGATINFTCTGVTSVTSAGFNIPLPAPALTAAGGATVDNPFNVTFSDDASWRAAITSIKIGSSTLPGSAYSVTAGNIQFDPSTTALLQTSGTYTITVIATAYGSNPVTQAIGAGVATHMQIDTQPSAPATNPGLLTVQPVVSLRDQYNNIANTSSATIVASATGASWSVTGSVGVVTSSGVSTYTSLSGSSAGYAPNAHITFNATGYSAVVSDTFNMPFPYGSFTYGTGGTFNTLADAINTLNGISLGGPVILNAVSPGWTEVAPSGGYILGSAVLNGSMSATNTITINGYPSGANTVITAPVGTGSSDFIFALAGADYVTINGINVQESGANVTPTTQMEYGYAFLNRNSSAPVDGCQYSKVSNCKITLSNTNTNHTYGFAALHLTTGGASATPTTVADVHSNNKVYTDTITNCQYPIYFEGYNDGSPYALYGQSNDVGGSAAGTGNYAANWGASGSVTGTSYGVAMIYQNNANVSYNVMNNNSGGAANTSSLYGAYFSGVNGTYTANRNTFSLTEESSSGSNRFDAIHAESAGSNITANFNTITMTESAGTNVVTNAIYSATSTGTNMTAKNNTINMTMSLAGANDLSGIYSNTSGAVLIQYNSVTLTNSGVANTCITNLYRISGGSGGTQTISNNSAVCTNMNTSANLVAYGNTVNAATMKVNNNTANITTIASAVAVLAGIANSGINGVQELKNNNLTITADNANTGNVFGISNGGGATTSLDCNYDTIALSTSNAGVYGIYNGNTTTIPTGNFDNNRITIAPVAAGTASVTGIFNNNGLVTTLSERYNRINVSTSTGGGAVYGIYNNAGNTVTATVSDNNITAATSTGAVNGIYLTYNGSMVTSNVNYDTIDLSMTGTSAANVYYIYENATVAPATGGTQNNNYNQFKSTSGFANNTGNLYFIANIGNIGSNNNINYNYNTGSITKTGNGGSFYCIYSRGITLSTGVTTIDYNSFSNINLGSANAVPFWGIIAGWNTGIPEDISYNTFNNITTGTSPAAMIQTSTYGSGSTFNYNKMSNVTNASTGLYGLVVSTVGSGGVGTAPGSTATATAFGGTFRGNRVNDFSNSNASGVLYGFTYFYNTTSAASTFNFYEDTVYNMTVSGNTAPGIYGLYQNLGARTYALNSIVNNCVFRDFSSTDAAASPVMNGIYFTFCDTVNVYSNRIYNFSAGSSAGAATQLVGINMVSTLFAVANTYNVYNNVISGFSSPASNNPNSLIGMYMRAATLNTWQIHHNTIAFGGLGVGTPGTALTSSGTNFGAAGVFFPNITSSVLNLKDNIIYMNVTPAGTGIAACVRRDIAGTAGVAVSSSLFTPNYNVYYTNSGVADGSSPKNFLYADYLAAGGTITNGYALSGLTGDTINNIVNDPAYNGCVGSGYRTSLKAYFGSGSDNQSYSECNLTSSGFPAGGCGPTGASLAYQNGVSITTPSITTDASGTSRSTPPSRGAYQFTGSAPTTGAPPVILYTPILPVSYCIASPPVLSVAITSGSGIDTLSGTKPRMYYRGSSDANALGATNDNTTDGWKYVEASNSSSPFTFQPNYSLLNHGASSGTVISYFVIAQDTATVPVIGYNIVGFAAGYCPSSVDLGSGAFPTLSSPVISTYTITSLPSFTTSVSPTNFYGSTNNATLTLAPSNSDLQLQWQMSYLSTSGTTSFTNIIGGTSNNYSAPMPDTTSTPPLASPGTSNNVSFQAVLTCNGSPVDTTTPTSVNDYTPQIYSTTGGSRCGTGAVTLSATGSAGGTINWYVDSIGGVPVATGNSYAPVVSSTTRFFVADTFGTYGNQSVGKADVLSSGTNGLYLVSLGYAGDGLFFKVYKDIKINTINLFSQSIGTSFTIAIYDSVTRAIVQSYSGTTSSSGSTTPNVVPVNFYLAPGNYKIAFSSTTVSAAFYMNTFFTSYPYTVVPNTITITGPQVSNYYELFYNWQVSSAVISSPRMGVTATVNPLPDAGSIGATPASVCTGGTTVLSETGTVTPPTFGAVMSSYRWSGPSGYSSSASAVAVGNATLTPVTGYYSLTVTYPGTGCTSTPVTTYVNVGAAVSPTITGTYNTCVGDTTTLTGLPGGGTWTTSNAAIASVDPATGLVTGVHAGTAILSYTNTCGLTDTQSFTVKATPISISGPLTICHTAGLPTFSVTTDGSSSGTWSSSPLSVAVINATTGALTSMAIGTATITFTTTAGCALTSPLAVSNVSPAAITGPSSVCVDGTITLADATSGGVWSSSDTTIATVSSDGEVMGISNGSATITYSTGCTPHATASVTVNGASVVLTNSGPICSGSTLSMTATPSTSLSSYSWTGPNIYTNTSSLTPNISSATIGASGTYTFSATVSGCTTYTTMAAVVNTLPTGVVATASNDTICVGGSTVLNATGVTPTTYRVYSTPYTPVTFTPTGTLTNASSWTSSYDDGYVAVNLPSGFAFNFYGTSYGTVYINANGYITFGSGVASGSSTPIALPSVSAPSKLVALFWHDMELSTGSITYGTTGTLPNRKFIISYNDVPDGSGVNSGQIILYESTNVIDLMVDYTGNNTKTCGIQNSTSMQALTVPEQNNASYSVTGDGSQGWRFATPSYSYTWSPAATLSSSVIQGPTSTGLSSTTVFTVAVADIYSSCSGTTANKTIQVIADPTVSLTASTSALCSGAGVTLVATPAGGLGTASYTWSGPGIDTTVGSTPTPSAFTATVSATVRERYRVALSMTGSGCGPVYGYSDSVTVATQPVVSITPSAFNLCEGDSLLLTGSTLSGGVGTPTYSWSGPSLSTTTTSSAIYPRYVPTVSTGFYSLTVTYSGTGCNPANDTTSTVTVNAFPSISLGATPIVCVTSSTAPLSYSGATGSPSHYSITWDSTALSAGFTNVTMASLGGVITLALPDSVVDTFSGTLTVSNAYCTSGAMSFSVIRQPIPSAMITSAPNPCSGHTTTITFTGTSGADVTYRMDSGSSSFSTMAGGVYNYVTPIITSGHTFTLISASNVACSVTYDSIINVNPITMQWVGGASGHESDWNYAANWSCGYVPNGSDDVWIPSGTTYAPVIGASAHDTTKMLTIAAGATVNINTSANLHVRGMLDNDGQVTGVGVLTLDDTSVQHVQGFGAVNHIAMNNSAGATIDTGSLLTIKGSLTLTSGTLTTNDSLLLYSDTVATARITPITGGALSGNVKVAQYIPGGRRAYRFWAHPFSHYIGLSQAQQYIDITGPGGASNGFTTTGSNAPSVFRYDPTVGNSAASYDPGWRSFGSVTPAVDSNKFNRYQGVRLFLRGAKGQGLSFGSYSPAPTTIVQIGQVNQGTQTVHLAKGGGANQDYNMVGNPYASPVDIGTIAHNAKVSGNIVGAAYYIWNPYLATVGQFQAVPVNTTAATPYYVQANAAFQVRAAHNNDSLVFNETHKGNAPTTNILRMSTDGVSLHVYDEQYHLWDMMQLSFSDEAASALDNDFDALKPMGPEFNFYSISADDRALAIDGRMYEANKRIPLGIKSNYQQKFIVKAGAVRTPDHSDVYLHDKYLHVYHPLAEGSEYAFEVTKDQQSQGDQRFELSFRSKDDVPMPGLEMTLLPNPTEGDVQLVFESAEAGEVHIRVLDVRGVQVIERSLGRMTASTVQLPTATLASGIYMVEFTCGANKITKKLIKQ